MRKNALVILSRYLWPVDGGRKESLNHYLKELYDNYQYDITVLCFLEASQSVKKEDQPYYINKIVALRDVSFCEKILNIFKYTLGTARWPFQCALYFSKENNALIQKYVKALKPDLIFTEMIRTCSYYQAFKDAKAIKLANLDDLLSLRYRRQLEAKDSAANFAGAYSAKLLPWIARFISSGFVKNAVLKMEASRCEIWEKKFYELYDYSLMTSDIERDKLNCEMNGDKAKTLTVGVDCEYYGKEIHRKKDKKGLSYVGNFSVASNADTLKMIVEEILPYIKSDYKFYVIGKCPDDIKNRYISNSKIEFCGRVDDLREYVKSTAIFISPIAYGTGIKTKIVEAMAMKMPVVTNSVGAEGINAKSGQDYIVSDNLMDIAAAVDRLLEDSEFAKKIGENAGSFAYEHFRWEKVFAVYKEIGV